VLTEDGPSKPIPVPLGTVGPNAHLRGDVLGNRIALLIVEYEESPQARTQRPRLVVLQRKGE